jgi:myo-inositol 2-dehydrogenase / D-chiro-inositol 1-dehydrogenase
MPSFAKPNPLSRRTFLRNTLLGAAGLAALPNILPSGRLFGASANRRLNIAQIGIGRMGQDDMMNVMKHPLARMVAVCDLDSIRLQRAREDVVKFYQDKGESNVNVRTYHDYRELLAQPDIDAVIVSTPDHWHALMAVEAALAGKHLYVQKPLTYNIAEAIALRTAVQARKVVLQTGSQQRSEKPFFAFRPACEAVRNGRVGKLKTIKIGIGLDKPKGQKPATDPVPKTLDYERWLGPAPEQPYMELRVHPQNSYGRPGWITTEDFGLGMITNWGAHHLDLALWAMGLELSGPTTIDAKADFMKDDVWTVHHGYHVEMGFANDVNVILDNSFENGLRFEGTDGWVFCSRGSARVTASDGNANQPEDNTKGPLRSSDKKILAPLEAGEKRFMPSPDHYFNWIDSISEGKQPIAPVEQSARSLEACAAAWIGMKLGRKLKWDPAAEAFVGDAEANALRDRAPRKPEYDLQRVMRNAGLAATPVKSA